MNKRALIVVDLQNECLPTGKLPLEGIDAALDTAARVIADARRNGDKVIHVRHEFVGDLPFFVPGSDGVLIHPKVAPQDGEHVITKNFPNSFLKTDLKATLDSAGIEHVTIIGAMSHMCIDATTRAGEKVGGEHPVVGVECLNRVAGRHELLDRREVGRVEQVVIVEEAHPGRVDQGEPVVAGCRDPTVRHRDDIDGQAGQPPPDGRLVAVTDDDDPCEGHDLGECARHCLGHQIRAMIGRDDERESWSRHCPDDVMRGRRGNTDGRAEP